MLAPALGLLLTLAAVDPAGAISAPRLQLQVADYDVRYTDYCLPSGLRVVFQEDHSQPVVSVTTVVGSGASADPEGMEGMAHLVEHLWFRSAQAHIPAVWQMRNRLGAWMNGYTSFDTTKYTTVAPSRYVRTLLEIEGQRLTDTLNGVDEAIFQTEREVVRNELRQNYENTGRSGMASSYLRLFPEGHPYHRSVIGDHQSLDDIDLEAAQAFAAEHYVPTNTTIMVVGDIDPDATSAWLAQSFPPHLLEGSGSSCEARLADEPPPVPDPVDTSFVREQAEVDDIQALITWAVPGGYRPIEGLERMVMGMLDWSLEKYQSRDPQCSIYIQAEASIISCVLDLRPPEDPRAIQDPEQRLRRALDGVHELWDMANRDWQARSYSRSRLAMAADLFLSGEEVSGTYSTRSTRLTEHLHHTADFDYFLSRLAWLEPIKAGHAAEFAAEYLDKRRAVVTILEPYQDRSMAEAGGEHQRGGDQDFEAPLDTDTPMEDQVTNLMVPLDLEELQDFELDTGLRVLMLPFGTMPYARANLLLPGGELHEPMPELERVTWKATSTLWKDEQGMRMSLAPSAVGGEWRYEIGQGWHEYGISGSGGNLEAQLYLLRQRLDSHRVKLSEKGDYVDALERSIWRSRERPEHWAAELARAHLAPDHPSTRPFDEATLEAVRALGLGDLKVWGRSIVQPRDATLVVVGRYDEERARDWVERWFGDWDPKAEEAPLPEPAALPDPPEQRVFVLDKPTATQTKLALRCQMAGLDVERALAQSMAAELLSGRTKYELRVRSGVTYGVNYGFVDLPEVGRLLTVSTRVQNSAAGEAVATMLHITDVIGSGALGGTILDRAKLARASSYAQGQQTTHQVSSRLLWPLERGMGLDYVTSYGERLAAITPADLGAQMERCEDHEVITLVGPQAEILPQLEELEIPYELFDWQAERDRLMQEHAPDRWKDEQKRREKEGG